MPPNDSMDQAPPTATLDDLLARFRREIELDLRANATATVVAYVPATQTATLVLGALPVKYIEGIEVVQPPITLPDVPVEWTGGALGYVTTPIVPGDTGVVTFTDRCLATWLATGIPQDPINGRTHNLADALFRPVRLPAPDPILPLQLAPATVVEGPVVALGALAMLAGIPEAVIKGTTFLAAYTVLAAAQSAYTSAVAAALTTWTNTGGPGGAPAANSVYIGATGAAYAVLGAAQAAFFLTAPTWLSTKVFTE